MGSFSIVHQNKKPLSEKERFQKIFKSNFLESVSQRQSASKADPRSVYFYPGSV